MLDIISNKLSISKLLQLTEQEKLILNTENHNKNMALLELLLLTRELSICIFLKNTNTSLIEIESDLISFLSHFFKDEITITDFTLLPDLNGLSWSQLERKWQRRLEDRDIVCNMIRGISDASEEELSNLLKLIKKGFYNA